MENLLLKYMDERFEKETKNIQRTQMGPVITISRECGCPAKKIAQLLSESINAQKPEKPWRWISKEILSKASEEMKIHPEKLKLILENERRNFIDEIVASFTETYYAHSTKVKRVIADVIREIAVEGNVIIIGRAANIIAADIPLSLHVSLEAPLSWRIEKMSEYKNKTAAEAKRFILENDKQRDAFKEHYINDKHTDKLWRNLSVNCADFTIEQIVDIILKSASLKTII